jgi:DNA (cytosine-5)-methyltransferase 1
MKYLSVCSGIEAATVAWHPLGWTPVGFGEIEKFPCQVLAHHYPDVTNFGDMTRFKEWNFESDVNVLVGGTPCQSFSVAGLRKGLDDPRGNLMLTYLAIAAKYRPKWLVWENVPGVLSSNGGLDFASLLRGMGELGYGFAYRVLDAQYFGVAQRRRRVFVIGNLGAWGRAAAVLFERESLSGNPPPSRKKGEGPSGTLESRTKSGGGLGDLDYSGGIQVCHPVRGQHNASLRADSDTYIPDICGALSDGAHRGGGYGQDAYSGRIIVPHVERGGCGPHADETKRRRGPADAGQKQFQLHNSGRFL